MGAWNADELVELYDRHARALHQYLAVRAGRQVADDLVSEVFLTAWERRADFDPARAGPKAWLYGIATNMLRHHVRSEGRRMRALALDGGRRELGERFDERIAELNSRTRRGTRVGAMPRVPPEPRVYDSPMQIIEGAGLWTGRAATASDWVEHLRAPDLSVGTYCIPAGGLDTQSPHTEDEIYVVTAGRAKFVTPDGAADVEPGSVIFVPAAEEHRFDEVTEDLALLVIFGPAYGSRG